MKTSCKWYFVILLCCFPLVGKIEKKFGHFFHIIEVQKVISRNVFSTSRGRRPRDVEKRFREITFWTKIIWKNGQIVLKFLLNKWKTIQVMQQSIFFYFGIDWNIFSFVFHGFLGVFPRFSLFFHGFPLP